MAVSIYKEEKSTEKLVRYVSRRLLSLTNQLKASSFSTLEYFNSKFIHFGMLNEMVALSNSENSISLSFS